nr:hypothetical protein [Tanacetum cinerariifolium]
MKIDPHHFNAESDLIESLLNHDSLIISFSWKIDSFLDEFAGELILLKSIPPGIDETDCDPEEEFHLIEKLLYDNSSPRPPKEFISKNSDAAIESFSPSHIPVEDSAPLMEEIDLTLIPDDSVSSGIEEDDYDSERDILILEELLSNNSFSLPEMTQVPTFQTLPSFPQQYPCCEDCEVTHEPYQCQLENHDYYDEQNSCYDSNSLGFDQIQTPQYTVNHPIFNAYNDLLDSQNKLMEQLTSICEMVDQLIQKKQEEKQIQEDQAANTQYWKIPAYYDDDDDEEESNSLKDNIIFDLPPCSAVTPNETVDSLIMGDKHLDTVPK